MRIASRPVPFIAAAIVFSLWAPARAAVSSVADAAMSGDGGAVATLLKTGADVNTSQGDGMTALHWAALHNDADLVVVLLKAGAHVGATTRLGRYTPVLLAAQEGSGAVLRQLLNAGANANDATTNGTTALMLASAAGNAGGLRALIEHGAAVNAREIKGQTALMFAAAYGRTEAIRILTAHDADLRVATPAIDVTKSTAGEFGFASGAGGRRAVATDDAAAPVEKAVPGATAVPGRAATPRRQRMNPYNSLVAAQGGITALLFASREGHIDSMQALLDAGADINQQSDGDHTSPLLMATINGHFDLAKVLLERGANPRLASENGVTPLYAALNCEWAPRAAHPQPRANEQERTTYLDLMKALLEKGADPDARVNKKPWYSGYNFDRSGIDETGATAFWRAAYASDIDAMRMLVAHGADPNIPTMKTPVRAGSAQEDQRAGFPEDAPKLPPIPDGGANVPPLLAAAGVGYGVGYSGNSHRFASTGMLVAVKYMVEELHMNVNATDALGNNAIHHAASRGDNAMIEYLAAKGANPRLINREGVTTVDMANAPVQKVTPFPDTIALLEKMGAKNHHRCMSC